MEVDPVAKAAADQLKKLVAPALGAARRLSHEPRPSPENRVVAVGDRVDVAVETPMTPRGAPAASGAPKLPTRGTPSSAGGIWSSYVSSPGQG